MQKFSKPQCEYDRRQFAMVEFSEKVYHHGLRHKGLNGTLYEDCFIKHLREDLPHLSFYKGQIDNGRANNSRSSQMDVIVCRPDTPMLDFIHEVSPFVNLVPREKCLGVIELKKWAQPNMIREGGDINKAYTTFKSQYPELKYLFVALRYKDRKGDNPNNWSSLSPSLKTDGGYCFAGRVGHHEWEKWNEGHINAHETYFGQYKRLIDDLKLMIPKH